MRLRGRSVGERLVGLLRAGGEGGQFLGGREEKEWRRGKIEGRRASGLYQRGRSRIHRGRVFHDLGLFVGVKRKQQLEGNSDGNNCGK